MIEHLKVNPDSNISITAQLIEQIRWLIASGELTEGDQLPPIRELGAQLGIHMHTVRIAYQRLEEEGLVSIHRRRGTIVEDFNALEMAKRSTQPPSFTFGVLMPDYNMVYEAMIRGITQAAQRSRWLPLFSFTNENPVLTDRVVGQMAAKQVDGFIVVSTGMMEVFEDAARLEEFPPIVFVDSPDMPGYSVLCDNQGAAQLSTQHLVDHGYESIGMVAAQLDWPNVVECYQGYRLALADNSIPFDPNLVVESDDFLPDSGYRAAMKLFDREQYPKAVFAAADSLAVGVVRALTELGLSIPEDVALTSFNDSVYAEMTHPQLTSSSFPAFEMGISAVEMLYKVLNHRFVLIYQMLHIKLRFL